MASYTLTIRFLYTPAIAMMDGTWMLRGGRERDEVRNDGVGLDGVYLGGYGAFLFVPRPP
jgi:hypothetical protein